MVVWSFGWLFFSWQFSLRECRKYVCVTTCFADIPRDFATSRGHAFKIDLKGAPGAVGFVKTWRWKQTYNIDPSISGCSLLDRIIMLISFSKTLYFASCRTWRFTSKKRASALAAHTAWALWYSQLWLELLLNEATEPLEDCCSYGRTKTLAS